MKASPVFAQFLAGAALLLLSVFVIMATAANVGAAGEGWGGLTHSVSTGTVIYKNSAEPRLVGSPGESRVAAVPCQVTREQFEKSVSTVAASWKFLEGDEAVKFLKVFSAWGPPTNFKADLIAFGFNSAGQIVGVALYLDGCTVNATSLEPAQYKMLMKKALGDVV